MSSDEKQEKEPCARGLGEDRQEDQEEVMSITLADPNY